MTDAAGHLSDAALLALLDGEQAQVGSAFAHMVRCPRCRERQQQLTDAGRTLQQLQRHGQQFPAAEEARLRLQRAMRAGSAPRPAHRPGMHRWSYAAAALLLLAAGLAVLLHRTGATVQAAEIPNHRLTPGMIRPVSLAEVCNADDGNQDPAVTPEVQRAVLLEYGLDPARAADYQIDYLITPQLGGTADVRNLWPEPYHVSAWNARAKDALETRLHQMVCERQIGLEDAQRAIATDWRAAYKRYVHAQSTAL